MGVGSGVSELSVSSVSSLYSGLLLSESEEEEAKGGTGWESELKISAPKGVVVPGGGVMGAVLRAVAAAGRTSGATSRFPSEGEGVWGRRLGAQPTGGKRSDQATKEGGKNSTTGREAGSGGGGGRL